MEFRTGRCDDLRKKQDTLTMEHSHIGTHERNPLWSVFGYGIAIESVE